MPILDNKKFCNEGRAIALKNHLDQPQHSVLASIELFDLLQEAIFIVAADRETFRLVYANPAAFNMLSLQKTDIAKALEEMTSLSQVHIMLQHCRAVHSSQTKLELTELIETENGIMTGKIILNPLPIEKGQDPHIFITINEVNSEGNTHHKKTVNLLQESEERYQSLVAHHPYGIFVFDANGHLKSGNTGTENVTGYSIEELLEKSFLSMIVPEEMEKVIYHFYETLNKNQLERYEFAGIHKNGHLLTLQATNIPILSYGKLVGVHCVVIDVTEITRAKQALNETKEELEVFWENSAVPIFYIDTEGDILKVNPAFEKTFGFSEEEMIARKATIIPPSMKADQLALLDKILRGETVKSHETTRLTKSGSVLNIISSYSPVRNEHKGIVGATIIYNNVTELKKIEKELQKSQEKYKLIMDNTLDIITLIDPAGQIEYVSPASEKKLGFPDHIYIGKHFTQNIHPEDALQLINNISSLLDGGKPTPIDVRYLHQDGQYIWMEVSPTPVFSTGKVTQLFTLARDVTERKRFQAEIARMAFYDHLSGIPNRRLFDDTLEKEFLSATQSNKKIALLTLDGRKFKKINDKFGHDAGDAVIKEMASRLQACIRPEDMAARLGGDEMGVIIPNIDSIEVAIDTAKRILKSYEAPFLFNGHEITLGAGIGISLYPDHAATEKQLIKCADLALYEAKKSDYDDYKVHR